VFEFEKLKNEIISNPITSKSLKALEQFSLLLNKMLIDKDYKLDYLDYFLLACKYYYSSDYTTALIYIDKCLELKNDFPRGYNLKGLIFRDLKRYNKALEFIDKAIELNPNVNFFWNNKSLILLELGFYKEALECEEHVLKIYENDAFALKNKAVILAKLKKYDEALKLLNKAISVAPDYEDAYIEKAFILIELGNYNEAIEILDNLIQKEENAICYYNRACAYALLGNKEKAIMDLKKAIDLDYKFKFIAMDDNDFKNIKDSKEFQEIIKIE